MIKINKLTIWGTRIAICSSILLNLSSCGGGTAGSSPTGGFIPKVIRGVLKDDTNQAIANASIRIGETGDAATTDGGGGFEIAPSGEIPFEQLTLDIQNGDQSSSVQLSELIPETSALNLNVQLGEQTSATQLTGVEFTIVGVVGSGCEGKFAAVRAFEFFLNPIPLLIVEQIGPIAPDTRCKLQVQVSPKGNLHPKTALELYANGGYANPFDSGGSLDERLRSQTLVSTIGVNGGGVTELEFSFKREAGFYLLEVSLGLPRSQRVGIVINLLKGL